MPLPALIRSIALHECMVGKMDRVRSDDRIGEPPHHQRCLVHDLAHSGIEVSHESDALRGFCHRISVRTVAGLARNPYTGGMKRLFVAAPMMVCAAMFSSRAQDSSNVARIRDEGMNRSHALELFDHLTTVVGPRLTASPAFRQSVDWAAQKLRDYRLSNVHLEPWPFGPGWTLEGQVAELTSPRYFPLIAYAEAWSPSTNGIIEGKPVYIGDLANADSVRAHASAIRGAIVLATKPQDVFITHDRLQPT